MLAVLGSSCDLRWRSWAALGAFVGGPEPVLGPLLVCIDIEVHICGSVATLCFVAEGKELSM